MVSKAVVGMAVVAGLSGCGWGTPPPPPSILDGVYQGTDALGDMEGAQDSRGDLASISVRYDQKSLTLNATMAEPVSYDFSTLWRMGSSPIVRWIVETNTGNKFTLVNTGSSQNTVRMTELDGVGAGRVWRDCAASVSYLGSAELTLDLGACIGEVPTIRVIADTNYLSDKYPDGAGFRTPANDFSGTTSGTTGAYSPWIGPKNP